MSGAECYRLFPPIDMEWHTKARRRYASSIVGGEADRIPVDTMMLGHGTICCGYTIRDFYEKPELGAHCLAIANEMYDLMPITRWFFALPWATELGLELVPMEHTAPVPKGPIISEPEEVDRLEVPSVEDIRKGRTFTLLDRTNKYLEEHIPDMFSPITYASEPMGGGAELCGMENFIMWTFTERDAAKKLIRLYTDTCINGADVVSSEYGHASITTGAVLANSDIFDPDTIDALATDNLKYLVDRCLRVGAGPQVFYHFCGNHEYDYIRFKDKMVYTPFTIMQIGYKGKDPFPADELKEHFQDRCTIEASVDTKMFVMPQPRKIYEQAGEQIQKGRDAKKGFIICTACEVPPYSPPGNIHALVRASQDFGAL